MSRIRSRFHRVWHAFDGLAVDTLWSGGHDLLLMINAFVSFQIVQDTFSQSLLGNYFGLFAISGVLGAFSYSGIGIAALQRLLGEKDDPNLTLRSYLSLSMGLGVAMAVVGSIAGGLVLKELSMVEVIVMTSSELLAVAVVAISSTLIQAASGFPAAVRVRLGSIAIRFSVTTTLYVTGNFSVLNLSVGFAVGFLLYAVWLLVVHLPRYGYVVSFGRPTREAVRAGLTFSLPMSTAKVQTDGDKFLLNAFKFEAEAGLYGAAYRAMQVANAPLVALEGAAFQRFLPKEEGQKGVHWRRANRFTLLMFAASSVLAVMMYFALPVVEIVMFRGDKKEAGDILPWLLGLLPLMALSGTPMNGMLGLGRAKERGYIFFTSTVVSVVLYVALIPRLDWRGALIATYLSEVFLIGIGWWGLWHYQRIADRSVEDEHAVSAMA